MEVSVIIPVGRDAAGLAVTLESIKKQQWDTSKVEVIVCNDGGGLEISDVIEQFECTEAKLATNRGSYAARNAGLKIARGRVLAFLDADETVTKDWLESGIAALEGADYVGGRILVPTGPDSSFWERVDAAFAFPVASYLRNWLYAPTANLFVKRRVFEEIGGFDEALKSGGDREFGMRVASHNLVQRYCEQAAVFHPARDFREQLRKIRRTSRGNATLEILHWRRPAFACGARSMPFALAKLGYAVVLASLHVLSRWRTPRNDVRLLAAGRAFIHGCYLMLLGLHAFALVFRRRTLRSSIPGLSPLR
jgi:glycosyltransferase involved in cell wall biosynthesis